MRSLIVLIAALALSGCANFTANQKEYLMVGAGLLVAGYIIANDKSGPSPSGERCTGNFPPCGQPPFK